MTWDIIGDLSLHQIQAIFSGVGLGIILVIGVIICLVTKCVCKMKWKKNVKDHLEEAARVEICDRDLEIEWLKAENETLQYNYDELAYILKAATAMSHKTSEILGYVKRTIEEIKKSKAPAVVKEVPLKKAK